LTKFESRIEEHGDAVFVSREEVEAFTAKHPQSLGDFKRTDLTTFDRDMAYLAGVAYGGVVPL